MTFHIRLTILVSLVVSAVLVCSSLVVYYSYRHDLLRRADSELAASLTTSPLDKLVSIDPGGTIVVPQTSVLAKPTHVVVLGSSLSVRAIPVTSVSPGYTASAGPYRYETVDVNGVAERRLTIFGLTSAITITRSLADVHQSLSRLRWLLMLTSAGGIVVAALLSALVSRRAIAPLRRLTEATEQIAATGELSARTEQHRTSFVLPSQR